MLILILLGEKRQSLNQKEPSVNGSYEQIDRASIVAEQIGQEQSMMEEQVEGRPESIVEEEETENADEQHESAVDLAEEEKAENANEQHESADEEEAENVNEQQESAVDEIVEQEEEDAEEEVGQVEEEDEQGEDAEPVEEEAEYYVEEPDSISKSVSSNKPLRASLDVPPQRQFSMSQPETSAPKLYNGSGMFNITDGGDDNHFFPGQSIRNSLRNSGKNNNGSDQLYTRLMQDCSPFASPCTPNIVRNIDKERTFLMMSRTANVTRIETTITQKFEISNYETAREQSMGNFNNTTPFEFDMTKNAHTIKTPSPVISHALLPGSSATSYGKENTLVAPEQNGVVEVEEEKAATLFDNSLSDIETTDENGFGSSREVELKGVDELEEAEDQPSSLRKSNRSIKDMSRSSKAPESKHDDEEEDEAQNSSDSESVQEEEDIEQNSESEEEKEEPSVADESASDEEEEGEQEQSEPEEHESSAAQESDDDREEEDEEVEPKAFRRLVSYETSHSGAGTSYSRNNETDREVVAAASRTSSTSRGSNRRSVPSSIFDETAITVHDSSIPSTSGSIRASNSRRKASSTFDSMRAEVGSTSAQSSTSTRSNKKTPPKLTTLIEPVSDSVPFPDSFETFSDFNEHHFDADDEDDLSLTNLSKITPSLRVSSRKSYPSESGPSTSSAYASSEPGPSMRQSGVRSTHSDDEVESDESYRAYEYDEYEENEAPIETSALTFKPTVDSTHLPSSPSHRQSATASASMHHYPSSHGATASSSRQSINGTEASVAPPADGRNVVTPALIRKMIKQKKEKKAPELLRPADYEAPADGLRRSRRARIPRMQHWLNEQPVYKYESVKVGGQVIELPKLMEVYKPAAAVPVVRKAVRRNNAQQRKPASFEDHFNLSIHYKKAKKVLQEQEEEELDSDIVHKYRNYNWVESKQCSDVLLAIISQHEHTATGMLRFSPMALKKAAKSAGRTTDFIVSHGTFLVNLISQSRNFVVSTGDNFVVSPGEEYSIKNCRTDEGLISFHVVKQLPPESRPKNPHNRVKLSHAPRQSSFHYD